MKKSEEEPFDFISKFNLPILNALWNITAGHRFEYDDPKLLSMIQVETRYCNDDDDFYGKTISEMSVAPW